MRSMTKLLVACLVASVAVEGRADPIDDYVNSEIARQHVPGIAIAVIRHGRIERARGYGLANLEHSVPVHADTLFKTGAVGMQFTAVGVMLLVEDGKIALDDPIAKYLPNAPQSWAPVTIRQLLNHTSGLPATPNGEFRTDYTDDQLLDILYKQDMNFVPGTRWRFSYADYIVLGFIIRKVSGVHYAEMLAERLFKPLGMQTARGIDELAIVPNRAAGYEMRNGTLRNAEWVSPTANSTADGSLYLSALDYAAWEAGMQGGKVLSPRSWAEIRQPARLTNGSVYPYGFGWYLGQGAGQQVWRHSGSWQGFRSFIIRYLGDEVTVVALANGDTCDTAQIARHVAAMIDPKFAQAPVAPIEDTEPQKTVIARRLLEDVAGGKADYRSFAYVSKLDFSEMMAEYQATLAGLGRLQQVTLFGRSKQGDDQLYVYRARYDTGLMDVSVGYAPNGRIGSLDLQPAER
jgi:CubicO group peptidase (beta-lactamase class C family)